MEKQKPWPGENQQPSVFSDPIEKGSSLLSERLVNTARNQNRELNTSEIDEELERCLKSGYLDDAYHVAKLGASAEMIQKMITIFQEEWPEGALAAKERLLK
jgi:hypothetical protein